MWDNTTITMLLEGTRDTLYMTLVSTFFGYVLGLPLGILLAVTDKEGIHLIARMVESSLKEVELGVLEAAVSMGAGTPTIIWKVLLAEARTSLLVGVTIAVGTILGYSAMAGTVGGGGLGDIAIRYGYYRYQTDIMIITIVILVVLVQILQGLGMMLSRKLDKRKA